MGRRILYFLCFLNLFIMSGLGLMPVKASEIIDGQAVIENGNTAKACEDARKDALRLFVESKVGVHVESTTEVANNMVVRDAILAHSDGYVLVKQVVKEWQSGDIYFIRLELGADEQKIRTAPQDLRGRLNALGDNTSRSGVQVAISGRDSNGNYKEQGLLNKYLQSKLESIGFHVIVNDEVVQYLASMKNIADDPTVGVEARRIARNTRTEENALIRGTLTTVEMRGPVNGYYEAFVNASFELIGLDSDTVNSFSEYFSAAARSPAETEARASDMAVQKAAEVLGQRALETVQSEYRGGVKHIKVTAVFANVRDRTTQRALILQGLQSSGCRIVRTAFASDGTFRVFLETDQYNTTSDLTEAVLAHTAGLHQGDTKEQERGSTKLYFSF